MAEFETWQEAAADQAFNVLYVKAHPSLMDWDLEQAHRVCDGSQNLNGFAVLGHVAVARSPYAFTIDEVVDTLTRKQRDYGPLNILKFGTHGLVVRTWDKIARIQNLATRDNVALNEPLRDSWLDLICYCVIGLMLVSEQFELPLGDES